MFCRATIYRHDPGTQVMKKPRIAVLLGLLIAFAVPARAQQSILQGGTWTTGQIPVYVGQGSSQPVVQSSGPASGGGPGIGVNELNVAVRGTGSSPYANAGTGPYGTNICDYDGPITSAAGYHFLCFSANANGGGLLAYGAAGGASSLPLQVEINGVISPIGTGTVNSGTSPQLAYYGSTGTTLSGATATGISGGALTLGTSGSLGSLILSGSASGAVSIKPQASAGTWEFDLPITAGTSGQVLTSQGGAGTPMTWSTFGGTVNPGSAGQFGYYAGTGQAISGSSVLTVSGTTLSTSNALTVGGALTASGSNVNDVFSPTGTGVVTINPATTGTIDNETIGATIPQIGNFTTLNATGQIASGVAGASIGSVAISGNTSGTVIIKPQAIAGSYNFNLPITAGTSGTPLLSGGGGAGAMTYGGRSGNTTTFGTTSGSLTNGHVAAFDASGNIIDGGTPPTGTINSGTGGQLSWYAGTGTTLSGNANATISSGALTLGIAGATPGSLLLTGSSTGTITVQGSGTTIGTYNFNLPTSAGTSGGPLLSGGGGASAMTFGTPSGNTTKFGTVTGALTNGHCIAADASGNLIDNGSTCGTGGSGTVTSSTAGQVAYYPSSTNAVAGNSSLTIASSALTVGVAGSTTGSVAVTGLTSGTITIKPQSIAGTYELDLPTTAGTAGQVLTSQGGAGTAMTWGTAGVGWGSGQTVNFNAVSNTSYCVDTATSGAVTATLPAAPADGDQIQFTDCKSNFATANLTVARNGKTVMALAQNMTVSTTNASFTLRYWSTPGDWRIQ